MPRLHSHAEEREFLRHLIREMQVTVAETGGRSPRPCGFLARREGFIHALYLAPQARRQGLGRRLLDAAKAERPALELWAFQANTPARAFYRAQGFAEVELGDGRGNDEGLPDVRLNWRRAEAEEAGHG
nr:GNAT family N-acetyltransferase [Frigidibacter sp. ROC022]